MNKVENYIRQKRAAVQLFIYGCVIGVVSYFKFPDIATTVSFVLIYLGVFLFFGTMEGTKNDRS